jgi:CRP-like cAMP-binding protein
MLFLAINYAMIALLLKEKSAASKIPEEQRHLFMSLFESHGMTSVEFLKLMGTAKRIEADAGDTIIQQGVLHRDVYLLQSGVCVVKRDGETLGKILKYQFMGEMSFLRWQDAVLKEQTILKQSNDDTDAMSMEIHGDDTPSEHNQQSKDKRNLKEIPNILFYNQIRNIVKAVAYAGDYVHDWVNYFEDRISRALDRLEELVVTPQITVAVRNRSPKLHGDDDGSTGLQLVHTSEIIEAAPRRENALLGAVGMKGTASVTCQEKCVLYVWDFLDLHELIQDSPRIGLCVEMCMSADLNNKFQSQTVTDGIRKYNQILTGALMNGDLIPLHVRDDLTGKRKKLSVSDVEHEAMVKRLGWTMEQFNAGNKYLCIENVVKYKALCDHILNEKIGKNGVSKFVLGCARV